MDELYADFSKDTISIESMLTSCVQYHILGASSQFEVQKSIELCLKGIQFCMTFVIIVYDLEVLTGSMQNWVVYVVYGTMVVILKTIWYNCYTEGYVVI